MLRLRLQQVLRPAQGKMKGPIPLLRGCPKRAAGAERKQLLFQAKKMSF